MLGPMFLCTSALGLILPESIGDLCTRETSKLVNKDECVKHKGLRGKKPGQIGIDSHVAVNQSPVGVRMEIILERLFRGQLIMDHHYHHKVLSLGTHLFARHPHHFRSHFHVSTLTLLLALFYR